MELLYKSDRENGLTAEEIRFILLESLKGKCLRKALLIPPDYTRYYSNAGFITNTYYHILSDMGCQVDILPALGSHVPMTPAQVKDMFGDIPFDRFFIHNWRNTVMNLGEMPADVVSKITDGLWQESINVEINNLVMDPSYDLIISIGQVVPHEVIGMSNHAKNLFVGVGGIDMINKSHIIGALYGMERIMGKDFTPVRKIFDYAFNEYLKERPIIFALTVNTSPNNSMRTHGLFIGDTRKVLEEAIALSQEKNIDFVEKRIKKCIVYLDPKEFHTTWLGNKAIYRTRMAVMDGGELIILAPGVERFGEDEQIDALIRKYGYCGRHKVLTLLRENKDLADNMSAAGHLIHGSSDGRFKITYAVKKITQREIEGVYYNPAYYEDMASKYDVHRLKDGYNTMPDGEEVYFIPNPALGLWIDRNRFFR